MIEPGRSSPGVRMVLRLCDALDITPSEMLNDVERRLRVQAKGINCIKTKTSMRDPKKHCKTTPHFKHCRITGRTERLSELVPLHGHGFVNHHL